MLGEQTKKAGSALSHEMEMRCKRVAPVRRRIR